MRHINLPSSNGYTTLIGEQVDHFVEGKNRYGLFDIRVEGKCDPGAVEPDTAFSAKSIQIDLTQLERFAEFFLGTWAIDQCVVFDLGCGAGSDLRFEVGPSEVEPSNPNKASLKIQIADQWGRKFSAKFPIDPTCFTEFLVQEN